jgi:hypothetical protein
VAGAPVFFIYDLGGAPLRTPHHRTIAVLLLALALCAAAAWAGDGPRPWRWTGVERVVAIGDVHGAYPELVELLEESGLISEERRWIGGAAHLVMLGDLIDRGSQSREVLDLLMELQRQASDAGGRVHLVLGNHEVMNLTGDLRYLAAEDYAAFAGEETRKMRKSAIKRRIVVAAGRGSDTRSIRSEIAANCPPGFFARRHAFSTEGRYGTWLLDQQIMVVIDDVAFVHGGLSPTLLAIEPDQINRVAMEELRDFLEAQRELQRIGTIGFEMSYRQQVQIAMDLLAMADSGRPADDVKSARRMVEAHEGLAIGSNGPLWYRGSSLAPADEESDVVDEVLEHIGARRVVVGHTPSHTHRIMTRFGGAVVRADTGMLASHYGGLASAVELRNGVAFARYSGEGTTLLTDQRWELTPSMFTGPEDVEEFLLTAPVVFIEELGAGSTRPQIVALGDNGRRLRAVFKTVDNGVPCEIGEADRGCRDSYDHEVAAYRVDRMLGLGMVPPVVVRRINGRHGSLQLMVEGVISEENRQQEDIRPDDIRYYAAQHARANVFDLLILNPDRTTGDLLYTIPDWKLHLVDHSKAFGPTVGTPSHLENRRIAPDGELAARLASMSPESLHSELGSLLTQAEITALLVRADWILEGSTP